MVGKELSIKVHWILAVNPGCLLLCYMQWSYGITCWEIFSGGRSPYPGVDPLSLAQLLQNGRRLDKPLNAACSDSMYVHNYMYLYIHVYIMCAWIHVSWHRVSISRLLLEGTCRSVTMWQTYRCLIPVLFTANGKNGRRPGNKARCTVLQARKPTQCSPLSYTITES